MENELREALGEEIKGQIEGLKSLKPGSDEHSSAVDSLTKLYKLKLDDNRMDLDFEEKYDRRILEEKHYADEQKLKEEQTKLENKHRWIKVGVEVGSIVVPLIFYAAWMRKGFKFEETGTFTSTTFRGLFQKFKPTR